ncbi:MAG: hypothetical protein QXK88_00305 [Desulfurococcaceae archaeon]
MKIAFTVFNVFSFIYIIVDYRAWIFLIVSELAAHLRSIGHRVETPSEKELKVLHDLLPVYLHVEVEGNIVYMAIKHTEDLRATLEELHESGENVEEIVEEALGYLSIVSLRVRSWVEKKGYIPIFKLREGNIKVYEILEELGEDIE